MPRAKLPRATRPDLIDLHHEAVRLALCIYGECLQPRAADLARLSGTSLVTAKHFLARAGEMSAGRHQTLVQALFDEAQAQETRYAPRAQQYWQAVRLLSRDWITP